jgi:hypothetical protein
MFYKNMKNSWKNRTHPDRVAHTVSIPPDNSISCMQFEAPIMLGVRFAWPWTVKNVMKSILKQQYEQ